jgi:ribonuclease HII
MACGWINFTVLLIVSILLITKIIDFTKGSERLIKMFVCGLDEAGRGCVMGSLVVAAVIFDTEVLSQIPVADSKKLSKKRREQLYSQILQEAQEFSIVEVSAIELNNQHRQGLTMNQIEVRAFAKALNQLDYTPDKVYLDAADVFESRFGHNVGRLWSCKDIPIVSQHNADLTIPVVSAASILAKVRRDEIMSGILSSLGAPAVSGYGDPKTTNWLKDYYINNGGFPTQVRYFWKTLERVKNMALQEIPD